MFGLSDNLTEFISVFSKYYGLLQYQFDYDEKRVTLDAKEAHFERAKHLEKDEEEKRSITAQLLLLEEEKERLRIEYEKIKPSLFKSIFNVLTFPITVPIAAIASVINDETYEDNYDALKM